MDFTLVMSSAVNPNGMRGVSEESLNGREAQYIRTLKFYARQSCIPRILFVDNSNWDLSHIKSAVGETDKVEYLSLDENNYPREWGKGYGEFLLMDRAVDRCREIAGGGGVIIKVTGRFPVLNISTMVSEFAGRKNLKLAVDVLEHPLYDWLHLGWNGHGCRTIIYAIELDFYKRHLYGRYREIPSCFAGAEGLMRDVWENTKHKTGVYSRFKHEPWLSGYAGAVNTVWMTANNYDGWLSKAKRTIRQICRYALPFLWL